MPQIFTRALECPRLASATSTGDWDPPYNFEGEVINWLKIQQIRCKILGSRLSSLMKLFHLRCYWVGVITTYNFWGHHPLKIWEGKNVQNLVRFTTFDLTSNISGLDRDINKR